MPKRDHKVHDLLKRGNQTDMSKAKKQSYIDLVIKQTQDRPGPSSYEVKEKVTTKRRNMSTALYMSPRQTTFASLYENEKKRGLGPAYLTIKEVKKKVHGEYSSPERMTMAAEVMNDDNIKTGPSPQRYVMPPLVSRSLAACILI